MKISNTAIREYRKTIIGTNPREATILLGVLRLFQEGHPEDGLQLARDNGIDLHERIRQFLADRHAGWFHMRPPETAEQITSKRLRSTTRRATEAMERFGTRDRAQTTHLTIDARTRYREACARQGA